MPGIDPKGDHVGRTSKLGAQSGRRHPLDFPAPVSDLLDALVLGGTTNIVDERDRFDPTDPDVTLLPEPPADWFHSYDNVVLLAHWLADEGHSAYEVADAVEKPHKFTDEYKQARWAVENA